MFTLPLENSRCRDALIIIKTPCNKITLLAVGVISLLLMGGGLYGHFVNPAMWGSYVILGIGAAGALVVLAALALKLVKTNETLVEHKQPHLSTQPLRRQPVLLKPDESHLPSLPMVRVNIRAFNDAKQQGPLISELRSYSFGFLERVKDIMNTALVCKSFYNEVFENEHCSQLYKRSSIFFNVHIRTTSPVRTVFGEKLEAIPMITDLQDNPSLCKAATDWPFDQKKCRALLPIFEREKSPIIKGFFSNDRLFIAIRYKSSKKNKQKEGDGVFVFFQYRSHTHEEWQSTQAFYNKDSLGNLPMRLSGGCLSEDSPEEYIIKALATLVKTGSVDSFKLWQPELISYD